MGKSRGIRWFTGSVLVAMVCTTALAGRQVDERIEGELMSPGVDGVTAPKTKRTVRPDYPRKAWDDGFEGSVTALVEVRGDGSVGQVEVLHASAPGVGFEDATIDAVSKWRYKPARRDGEKVDSYAFVRLHFIQGDGRPSGRMGTDPRLGPGRLGTGSSASGRPSTGTINVGLVTTRGRPVNTASAARPQIYSAWQRHRQGMSPNPPRLVALPGATEPRSTSSGPVTLPRTANRRR